MARNEIVDIPANAWTELTDGDVTAITFQVLGNECTIAGTTGAAPTGYDGLRYKAGTGEALRYLAEMFPGVTGADRVWCYSLTGSRVFVSHA